MNPNAVLLCTPSVIGQKMLQQFKDRQLNPKIIVVVPLLDDWLVINNVDYVTGLSVVSSQSIFFFLKTLSIMLFYQV